MRKCEEEYIEKRIIEEFIKKKAKRIFWLQNYNNKYYKRRILNCYFMAK